MADVVAVHVDDKYIDEKGKFCFESTEPVVYSHGEYYGLGRLIGNFGYSVKEKIDAKTDIKSSSRQK